MAGGAEWSESDRGDGNGSDRADRDRGHRTDWPYRPNRSDWVYRSNRDRDHRDYRSDGANRANRADRANR